MSYECPVCGKRTATAIDMCKHMRSQPFPPEKHIEWIEARGISYPEMLGLKDGKLGKGSYKALAEVVERECKIQNKIQK